MIAGPRADSWSLLAILACVAGLGLRLYRASQLALNPDECWHVLLALHNSWSDTWAQSLTIHHPPLLVLTLRALGDRLLLSETGARLPVILASSLFPLIIFFWLRRRAGLTAALSACLLLQFAPRMISLGTQVRSYMLAFLFLALTLWLLDRAIDHQRPAGLAAAGLAWALAAFSDYSAALLCPAIAVYGWHRLWQKNASRAALLTWTLCVAAVAAEFAALYFFQLAHLRKVLDANDEWIADLIPSSGPLTFWFRGLAGQFSYFFGLPPGPKLVAVPAALALFSLGKHRNWWPLTVLPFATALILGYLEFAPLGASRHTSLLSLPIVLLFALAIQTWLDRPRWLAAALALAIPVWLSLAGADRHDWPPSALRPAEHRAAARFTATEVPKFQPMLVSASASYDLRYYLAVENLFAPVLIASDYWDFPGETEIRTDVRALRSAHGLAPGAPVWLAETGFPLPTGLKLGLKIGQRHGLLFIYPLPPESF